jgi:NAD(P)-dependent dehydrogenase (short-subunit alcohol dehydrogenase family)
MGKLVGKVAIITGAAGGLGKAMVTCFVHEGAKVVATDINETNLARLEDELQEYRKEIYTIKHDVSNEQEWENVVEFAIEKLGKINILINNAGYLPQGGVEEETLSGMKKGFDILVHGIFLGMNKSIPCMKKLEEPCAILNVSSVCGAYVATEDNFTYNAAKSAVVGMTRAAAVDLAGTNIRVNSIHPGTIHTAINEHVLIGKAGEIKISKIPMGRVGEPKEIASVAAFLCSDEASYVNGTGLVVDGGQILGYRNPASFSAD